MSFDALAKEFKKDYGDDVGGKGYTLANPPRLITGWFPLDFQLGGGLPEGRFIELYGAESSCKTNLALLAIAAKQRKHPHKKNAFFDIENSFDPEWARQLGVDVDNLYVFNPDYAEQVVDMTEGLLHSDECGLVVIDSLAAMVTSREATQSAEKQDVGGGALAVQKLVKKAVVALKRGRQKGEFPTLIGINQTRNKIGVMFGNPETTPGGNAPKFAAGLRLRMYGKNVLEDKTSMIPPRKKITTQIVKWKFHILARTAEFEVAMIDHKGLSAGDCDNWKLLSQYMEKYGLYGKDDKGWHVMQQQFPTQKACKEFVMGDPEKMAEISAAIIQEEMVHAIEPQKDGKKKDEPVHKT